MKVSIVMPSLNHAAFLPRALDSLVRQRRDGVDLEIIVMDGGSDDGSVDVIRAFGSHIDVWQSRSDGGQTQALNAGFARSTGTVMGWLNSDDLLLPGALAAVVARFRQDPVCRWLYGDAIWIDRTDRVLKPQRETDFDEAALVWGYNYIPQPATFWHRSLWEQVGPLDCSFACAMDYDLWMRFLAEDARPRHLRRYLAAFRCYASQKNQRMRRISDREDHAVREAFVGRSIGPWEASGRRLVHRTRRLGRRFIGGAYFERLRGRRAAQSLVDAATVGWGQQATGGGTVAA